MQLRDKEAAPRDFFRDGREALQLARAAGARVIINDRVDIALALKADGVHLGQADMPIEAARRLLGANAIIGYSTHNLDQVQASLHLPIDYLAFGPIFITTSKENPDPIAGLAQLTEAKRLIDSLPLVAIGGITSSTLDQALAAGADSVAVISALFDPHSQIAENLRNLRDLSAKSNG